MCLLWHSIFTDGLRKIKTWAIITLTILEKCFLKEIDCIDTPVLLTIDNMKFC